MEDQTPPKSQLRRAMAPSHRGRLPGRRYPKGTPTFVSVAMRP
jgi:hypothetical protein